MIARAVDIQSLTEDLGLMILFSCLKSITKCLRVIPFHNKKAGELNSLMNL